MRRITDHRFTALLEAAPDAMVCVAGDGQMALVNPQAERLFGYRRAELIGHPVEILVPDGVRDSHPGHRAGYVADPRPRPMGAGAELAGRRRDGTMFPAEISLSAIDTDEGILIMAAVRDVTERRLAAETAARLASIIQSSHDAVIGKTAEMVITSWNPGAERLYGYSAEEMIGRHVEVLIPAEDREREAQVLGSIVRGERVEQYQTRRVRKDGSTVAVALTLSPITDSMGMIVGVSTVARDATERQRAEARFVGLLEAAPDAMVCVDADGRIALVNAQAERLFGYRRAELTGQPVEILVPDEVRDSHPGHRAGYVAEPRPRPMSAEMQLAARRRDGSTFPAEISLSAIDTDEGILITAAVRDVTERLETQAERERLRAQAERGRLEHELQQSRRLESLGQLAGGVAHDFNNLLGVISNYASFAGEEIAKEPQARWQPVRDDIEQVQKAADRAAGLTRQLLAFARQEVIQPRVLNLNDMVTSVEQLLLRTLGEHVELIIDLSDDLGPVLADAGQIEQVLVNLAVNARDAMRGGGKLTIQTANACIDEAAADQAALAPGNYVTVKVSDTGTGIPKEIIDRVFEPFFTTKQKGEGSGLGLATVYGIITQAHGHLRIYSEPGVGTVVTALLPVTDRAAAAGAPSAAEPQRGNGETVLVVEDEDAMREVTRRILARNGYEVVAVAGGQEALRTLTGRLEHIDVLLTDVIMPQMQGKELADKVRVLHPEVRVVFMSGYTEGVLSAQGVLEPGIDLIEKPFSETTVLSKLREVLSGHPGTPCS